MSFAAGCAVAPPERLPRLTPSDDILPNFVVPDARRRMVFLARQEWTLFGQPRVRDNGTESFLEFPPGAEATHEVQGPMLSRVLTYWYAVTRQPIVGFQGELRPWSAAFISWLAKSAGLSQDAFPSTVLHWDYIAHALNGDSTRFVAHDARAYAPQVGDLLCAPRGEAFVAEVRGFSDLRRGAYHCDLVVERHTDALDAIGGNVSDAVSLTRVALDAEGRVVPTSTRPWVVVLEQR
ncbi:MAG: hypothetical protein AMJ64_02400 [Betaproteobacteria bacterium SG8_39]|nr:MAG: hypothetical protein AMJ64_02400 [Betaproteobacteria bacterium SG8_39]